VRASRTFSDGILLLHSKTTTNDADDGYREEPAFYYLTGLENLPSAILAIDGKGGDSWLFLDTKRSGDVRPGAEAERNLDIQHVVDWSELDGFLTRRIATGSVIYFEPGPGIFPKPFESDTRYDHLDASLRAGDLMRLDVGANGNTTKAIWGVRSRSPDATPRNNEKSGTYLLRPISR
jgi:hypothetical protein